VTRAEALARIAEFPAPLPGGARRYVTRAADRGWRSRSSRKTHWLQFFSFLSRVDWKDDGLEVDRVGRQLGRRMPCLMKTRLGAGVTVCDSITAVYRGAGWMEREAFDMFGIRFEGHPDLRRILLRP
jgi:hypothetical protein